MKNEITAVVEGLRDSLLKFQGATVGFKSKLENASEAWAQALNPSIRQGAVVTEACAKYLGAMLCAAKLRLGLANGPLEQEQSLRLNLSEILGVDVRTALSESDIQMPVQYGTELAKLEGEMSDARRFATVVKISKDAKLPRQIEEPEFGLIDASTPLLEPSARFERVPVDPPKYGGVFPVPSEFIWDAPESGYWIARVSMKKLARLTDRIFFLADGTAPWKSISGVCKKSEANGCVIQLGATKTRPSDISLTDVRSLRDEINPDALEDSAFYMNRSMETKLLGFNSAGATVYVPNGQDGPTLDGYPVRWVKVLPGYSAGSYPNQLQLVFGDLSQWWLCDRELPSIQSSSQVWFVQDLIAMRALARSAPACMDDASTAVLKLAAS